MYINVTNTLKMLSKKWWVELLLWIFGSLSLVGYLFFSTSVTYESSSLLMITTNGSSYANFIFQNTEALVETDFFYSRIKTDFQTQKISLTKTEYLSSFTLSHETNAVTLNIDSFSAKQNVGYQLSGIIGTQLIKMTEDDTALTEFTYLKTSDHCFGTSVKDTEKSKTSNRTIYQYAGVVAGAFFVSLAATFVIFGRKYDVFEKKQ